MRIHDRVVPSRLRYAAVILVALVSSAFGSSSQAPLGTYVRLVGQWIKAGTGERIDIERSGDVEIFLYAEHAAFSGPALAENCTLANANLCISGSTLSCAFHYEVVEGDIVNLVLISGNDPCRALAGDYRRRR
jgi:hypothetical protein